MRSVRQRMLLSLSAGVVSAVAGTPPASAQSLTLSAAVDSALATHPSIAGSVARERGATEGADAARSAWWPNLALNASIDRFDEPMLTQPIHGFDPATIPPFDRTLVQGSLGMRYTLLDWGGRGSDVRAAESGMGIATAEIRASRAAVIVETSEAYLRVVAARAVDAAAAARVRSLEAEVDRVTRRLDAGTSAEVEVLRASVALQDARAERISSSGAVRLAVRNLARTIGSSEGAIDAATLVDSMSAAAVSPSDDRWSTRSGPADTVMNPRLEQAGWQIAAARAQVGAQKAGRWPRLDLTGALLDFGTLDTRHVFEWQAGLSLSWPLFTGGRREASVRRAEANLLAAQHDLDAVSLQIDASIDASRTAVEAADARVTALVASVDQWTDLVRIEALALEAGAGTQRDLLDAEAGLFRARSGLVEARASSVLARVRLAAARGTLDRDWIDQLPGGTQ